MLELVSVIITTYMRPAEIVFKAIDSVRKQTYPEIEIIVVDDSPPTYEGRKHLQDEILKLGTSVKYIQHPFNQGACAARNTGLEAAHGVYVAFLDDDDEWLPEKIEKQLLGFTDADIALVYSGAIAYDESSDSESVCKTDFHAGHVYDALIYHNFIGSTSIPTIKKSALEEIVGFDIHMKAAQDYDVWLRLSRLYKFNYIEEPLVKYHIHGGNRISSNYLARISGQERLIHKNMDYLVQHPRAWWWRHLRLALQCGQAMLLKKALKIWAKGCAKRPQALATNVKYLIHIVYVHIRSKLGH